ncbi:MAG TPA: TIR domain-containing protein [Allosphingosinicella sp.]|nr:TIR domain-containing protein [Allosphingosinicella sp.]
MSVALTRSAIARIQKALADLRNKDAAAARKEADLTAKVNRAAQAAGRASSPSTASAKLREAERAQNDLATLTKTRADIAKAFASKTSELTRLQDRLASEEDQDRKKTAVLEKKLEAERAKQIAQLDQRLKNTIRSAAPESTQRVRGTTTRPAAQAHDVFISHASEDKEDFVRDLANRLAAAGLSVWYDEFSLNWGDSLRQNVDRGLASARYGIVVLSSAFFKKEWPQRELDGLFQLEMAGRSRILPIWHKVSKDEVAAHSPMLADKLALNTAVLSVDEIVARLVALLADGGG